MYYFIYKVKFYDDCDCENKEERGIISVESMAEGLSSIEKYYGKDNVLSIQMAYVCNEFGDIKTILSENDFPFTVDALFAEMGE